MISTSRPGSATSCRSYSTVAMGGMRGLPGEAGRPFFPKASSPVLGGCRGGCGVFGGWGGGSVWGGIMIDGAPSHAMP